MFQPVRRRKTSLFWLAVAACGGGIGGVFIVVISVTVLLVITLGVFVGVDTKSSNTSNAYSTYSGGAVTPLDVTTNWTGARNQAVVNEAVHIASAIYDCGPDQLGTCYDAALIPDAVAYWQRTCPGCAAWQNGDLQCVMLVTAAFGLAGQSLPYVGNAITFYTSGAYLHAPGWEELSPLSMPEPGDMIVMDSPFFGGVGHIVIVVDVKPPHGGQAGYVQFAEANGPGSVIQEPLTQDASGGLHMQIWTDYTVECYIRHTADSKITPV